MRIMEIISGTAVNGAVVNCLDICRALSRRGHDVTLVCRPGAWISEHAQDGNIRVIESSLDRWPLTELRRVAHVVRENDIQVIHTHMSRANFFGVLLRWLFGVPACVATAHSRYIQLHWMFNDRVIAVSDATRRFHQRYNLVRGHRIDVIHNFINEQRFMNVPTDTRVAVRREFGLMCDQPTIGVIGDVIPRKGLIHLIRALPLLIEAVPDVRVLAVGCNETDYAQQVQDEAAQLRVSDRVIWAGPRNDIERILAALDIYVLPSLEENMPLAILEAMAAGLPVVASEVGGIPECVAHQQTGLLVPPGEPESLASALIGLLTHLEQREQMGGAGQHRVRTNFSIESQIQQIEQTLERAAA
ncbi:MAG: glycosyltransferase family 4 protein [Planctomycetales bacterium]|nr:glycosyltransferase family 4 protein [Planctomycetales bacterium]MCA9171810.1 glycosyltransferase family 4 protein [Planctomycetales bacterium]